MNFQEFFRYHLPALEADEVRFNVLIGVIKAAARALPDGFQYWTLGEPGHCAIKPPSRSILLGALDRNECQQFAREIMSLEFPGVLGSDDTAKWFAQEATSSGINFNTVISQRIHALDEPPHYPGAEGSARGATVEDAQLLFEWMSEFHREAIPFDPPPQRDSFEKDSASGRWLLWTVGGKPVSAAVTVRNLQTLASIGGVFTPQDKRGRGYAGSVTAALSERIFAEGKRTVCLHTDLRNPYSNRCYAKIGFKAYCDFLLYLRWGGRYQTAKAS